jgi:hypothetical protein
VISLWPFRRNPAVTATGTILTFGRVIPPVVQEELKAAGAPAEVRDLLDRSRGWLEAVSAPSVSDPILAGLDPGEEEAIG